MYISLDNNMLEASHFTLSAASPFIMYGYGLFETLKIMDSKICFFNDHIDRMKKSCSILDIAFEDNRESILKSSLELIELNKIDNGNLRISCLKNGDKSAILIQTGTRHYASELYEQGYKLCISETLRNETSILSTVKSINYLDNLLEKNKAVTQGFDEVIFLNTKKEISEGSVSNIFWVSQGALYTPAEECGILSGIARQHIIKMAQKEGISLKIGHYDINHLYEADEVFITNSLMCIMPVIRLNDKYYELAYNSLTQKLMGKYKEIVKLNCL